jgi:hypothetical protein
MTVAELLHRISSHELEEWLEFMILEAEEEERRSKAARGGRGHDDNDEA